MSSRAYPGFSHLLVGGGMALVLVTCLFLSVAHPWLRINHDCDEDEGGGEHPTCPVCNSAYGTTPADVFQGGLVPARMFLATEDLVDSTALFSDFTDTQTCGRGPPPG